MARREWADRPREGGIGAHGVLPESNVILVGCQLDLGEIELAMGVEHDTSSEEDSPGGWSGTVVQRRYGSRSAATKNPCAEGFGLNARIRYF
jgi:hypothetical protein